MKEKINFIMLISWLMVGCSKPQPINSDYVGPVFKKIPSSESHLNFTNTVVETDQINILTYDYFYNGGGVAVGDINNDGLPDIFFTANNQPNALYINKGNLKFEDITESAGLGAGGGWKTGVTMVDVNADGYLDIYVCRSGRFDQSLRRNQLYINNKNLTFVESASVFGIDDPGYSTQASFFDYDNDGDLDLYLLNHNVIREHNVITGKVKPNDFVADKFYEFNGTKYIDVTKKVGLINNSIGYGLGVATGDLNNDGFVDLYITNDYLEQDYMYYNTGKKSFVEVIKDKTNHTSVFSMGCDIADFNNDGLADIITADMVAEDNYRQKTNMASMNPDQFYMAVDNGLHHQYMINTLQLNQGKSFSEISQLAGISNTDWSWATLFADLDNDRKKDLIITNGYRKDIANKDFVKHQNKEIEQVAKNDAPRRLSVIKELLEEVPSTKIPNYVFKNEGNLSFTKKSKEWGFDDPSFSNGAAYGDFDNDGDLDLVINNIDHEAFLFQNLSTENKIGNYIKIELNGPKGNYSGIGAKLELTNAGETLTYEQFVTKGYQSSVDHIITIGVGDWQEIEKIKVIWPGNFIQEIKDLDVNLVLTLDYADANFQRPDFSFATKVFTDISASSKIDFEHQENRYDDFAKEILLPHRMSNFGPSIAVGDINADGLEDFYVGGASEYAGAFYVQNLQGKFTRLESKAISQDALFEDLGTVLFDFDLDGDLDLYVVSGGNERPIGDQYYQDRLYINQGKGEFERSVNVVPLFSASGGKVITCDINSDGFTDLLVCGRQSAGKYPYPGDTRILINKEGKQFIDDTENLAPEIMQVGMVTDANFSDFDADGDLDLFVVGEWMAPTYFENQNGRYVMQEQNKERAGWWFSVASGDFNNDGKIDLVGGNLGLNYKYKASKKEPFQIYANDFDGNGSLDIVLGYYNSGELFPLRGRQCSSQQMPFIKEKFEDYNEFGTATLKDVYGDQLESALYYKALSFASSTFIQSENGFRANELPIEVQFSSINAIIVHDFNGDGNSDLLMAGNLFASEVETTRNDAGRGALLFGNGKGDFRPLTAAQSGLNLMYDAKDIRLIQLANGHTGLLVANNQGPVQLLMLNSQSVFLEKQS